MNIFVTARVPNRKTGREEGREGGRDKFCLLDESFSLFSFFFPQNMQSKVVKKHKNITFILKRSSGYS